MEDLQRISVSDHIGDLMREGDSLRAERLARERTPTTYRPGRCRRPGR